MSSHRSVARQTAAALLAIGVSAATWIGCGGSDGDGGAPIYPAIEVRLPVLDQAQSLTGEVRYAGPAKAVRSFPAPDAACARDGHEIPDETWVIADGRLANVLVYVKSGLENYTFDYEKAEIELDQDGCMFRPHVLAIRSYQPIRFKNSDPIVHNVNAQAIGRAFGLGPQELGPPRQITKPVIGSKLTCDLHANMLAYLHVLDHPYFRVTGADGRFDLGKLPPGTYTIAAWHEAGKEQTQQVTIQAQEPPPPLDFTFSR